LRPVLLLASSLNGQEDPWADCVSFDYRQRGRLAARYLLDKGHQRIGFLSPAPDHSAWNTVARSFQKFAQAKGVEPFMMISERGYEGSVWHSLEHRPIVAELIDRWQREPAASRPTGIYVVKDEITQVVYQELQARQIKPGSDVEILSTDNIAPVLSSLQPRPATLDLNPEELASRALEKVFYRINNPDAPLGTVTWVPATLVEGDGRSHWHEASVKNEQESL
jgi:LacI family transcriptional regulator